MAWSFTIWRRFLQRLEQYDAGVRKELLDQMQSGSLTAGKELKVTRRGNIAWTTVPMHFSAKMKDGKTIDTPVRYTGIWEKKGNLVLVHEHLSARSADRRCDKKGKTMWKTLQLYWIAARVTGCGRGIAPTCSGGLKRSGKRSGAHDRGEIYSIDMEIPRPVAAVRRLVRRTPPRAAATRLKSQPET